MSDDWGRYHPDLGDEEEGEGDEKDQGKHGKNASHRIGPS